MIFSSPAFILLYLPVVFLVYFLLNKFRLSTVGKAWLVAASLFFYGYWSVEYLPLMLLSIVGNFLFGLAVSPKWLPDLSKPRKKLVLGVAVLANLALLGYYKYVNFFIENINGLAGAHVDFVSIVLPLGISFYTFTQIAFLVDSYRGEVKEYSFLNYVLFVTFFPHLIAGPILHHKEMISQFQSRWGLVIRNRNILIGLVIFSIGLFKKVVIADTFSVWADQGFDVSANHDFYSAWATSLSYTFQLYFDFSGYCDMAIGAALLFNVWLPINFNSPYKALDIQDFWRRWHITLSRYLRDYLYIPLGGNRCSENRVYFNLMATFVLGGLWHGASWMFIIWGALHGFALMIHRFWTKAGMRLPKPIAWAVTFVFINITWVYFRATSLDDAHRIIYGMFDLSSISSMPVKDIPTGNLAWGGSLSDTLLTYLPHGVAAHVMQFAAAAVALFIVSRKNSFEIVTGGNIGYPKVFGATALFGSAMYLAMASTSTVFLYFNF